MPSLYRNQQLDVFMKLVVSIRPSQPALRATQPPDYGGHLGTWICDLRVAEKLLDHFPQLDEVTFTFGNLSPDSGIPNADWTQFDPPKEVTHFLRKGEGEDAIHDLEFYEQYLANVQPEEDIKLYSFRLGYFLAQRQSSNSRVYLTTISSRPLN